MAGAAHLARRFLGALDPRGPGADDEGWVAGQLLPGEVVLWRRMSGPDRRHAVGVGRRVVASLGDAAERAVVAAALLHDVGKVESDLGTLARVPATLAGLVARERVAAGRGRVARYLRHDAIGRRLLIDAGSDPLTSAWAGEHHRPPTEWTIAPQVAAALKAADDD
jgi:hypothetical protein